VSRGIALLFLGPRH